MSAAADARGAPPRGTGILAASVGFWALQATIAAAAAWPIYRSGRFLLLVAVTTAVAASIAVLLRRRSPVLVAGAVALAYLLLGVPLAVPSALAPARLLPGWLDLVAGTVLSWKELATISTIPVGSYQRLLVPALIVFLVGGAAGMGLAIRARRAWVLLVPIGLALQAFAIVFGSASLERGGALALLTGQSSRQAALGLLAFLAGLGYLLWRVHHDRQRALRRARALGGIRQSRQGAAVLARRVTVALATVVVALLVATLVAPSLTAGGVRQVLRDRVLPDENPALTESPLTDYRASFAGDAYTRALFEVSGDEDMMAARIRLAVLSFYDGEQYRAVDSSGGTGQTGEFVRVPATLNPPTQGESGTLTLTIDGYDGAWLPTLGDLVRVDFAGPDASEDQDSFFYNQSVQAGVLTGSLGSGDEITLTATVPSVAAAELGPAAGGVVTDVDELPASLVDWVRAQPDQSLEALVASLRARGYLSHSIFAPTEEPSWLTDLGGSTFAASRAGHSLDRIETLFSQLLAKQQQAAADASDADLVAAVGDDEQFAVASALLARYLGYSARVVLGFALAGVQRTGEVIPACTDVCRGENLTAWVEVQDATGAWVALDTTPQHTEPLNPAQTSEQPPKNGTEVLPDAAEPEQATASDPTGSDETDSPDAAGGLDLAWLAAVLRTAGLILLAIAVLLAPFASILVAKARRRRRRRDAVVVEERIVGGWDEYVDAAVDHGRPPPTTQTRSQTAALYGTPQGGALAALADTAVFGPVEPVESEAERFWAILEQERLVFERDLGRWRRLVAALSLRSFLRRLPVPGSTGRPAAVRGLAVRRLGMRKEERRGATGAHEG
ncbi:MAG: transglutaminase domain-containing protein [Microbacteriaceae bacterium]